MRNLFLTALVAVVLGGCGFTATGDAYREFLKSRGQKAADQTAKNAKDYLCEFARVGSISRLFINPEDRFSYLKICSDMPPMAPILPAVPPTGAPAPKPEERGADNTKAAAGI